MERATSTTKTTTGRPRAGRTTTTNSGSGSAPLPSFHYSRYGFALAAQSSRKKSRRENILLRQLRGFPLPQSVTIHRNVPSPALRMGLLTDSNTGAVDYNLNNAPMVYNGMTVPANYGCATAPGGLCDPLGVGLNPLVSNIWSTYEPPVKRGLRPDALRRREYIWGSRATLVPRPPANS